MYSCLSFKVVTSVQLSPTLFHKLTSFPIFVAQVVRKVSALPNDTQTFICGKTKYINESIKDNNHVCSQLAKFNDVFSLHKMVDLHQLEDWIAKRNVHLACLSSKKKTLLNSGAIARKENVLFDAGR